MKKHKQHYVPDMTRLFQYYYDNIQLTLERRIRLCIQNGLLVPLLPELKYQLINTIDQEIAGNYEHS